MAKKLTYSQVKRFFADGVRQGMLIVGLPYSAAGHMTMDEISGGSLYVPRPSAVVMVRVNPVATNWRWRVTRAGMSKDSKKTRSLLNACHPASLQTEREDT